MFLKTYDRVSKNGYFDFFGGGIRDGCNVSGSKARWEVPRPAQVATKPWLQAQRPESGTDSLVYGEGDFAMCESMDHWYHWG